MFESFKYRKRIFETDEQRFQRQEWQRKRFIKSFLIFPPILCVFAMSMILPKPDLNPYEKTTGIIIEKKNEKYQKQINVVEYQVDGQIYTIEIESVTSNDKMTIYYHEDDPNDANNDFSRKDYQDEELYNKLVVLPRVIVFIAVAIIECIILFIYKKRKKELQKIVLTEYTADELRDKYLNKSSYVYHQQNKLKNSNQFQYNVKTYTNINGQKETDEHSGITNNPEEVQAIMNEILDKVNDKLDDGIENNSNKMWKK